MMPIDAPATGQFCWLDLAASDAAEAKAFYRRLFGWAAVDHHANGGIFTRLCLRDRDVGSLYQMEEQLARKISSHWTPYVRVQDVERAVQLASALGGQVLVRPFDVSGVARIALIMDSVGAHIGLWESSETARSERYGE